MVTDEERTDGRTDGRTEWRILGSWIGESMSVGTGYIVPTIREYTFVEFIYSQYIHYQYIILVLDIFC